MPPRLIIDSTNGRHVTGAQLLGGWMLLTKLKHFAREESGATSIEYALIASIVSVSIIVALRSISVNLQASYDSVASAVQPAN